MGHCTALAVNSKILTPFSSRYASSLPPVVSVAGCTLGALIGSIMCAAAGLTGIMLPGVAVVFIPISPEFMGVLPDSILFCGTGVTADWREVHAARASVIT